MKRSLIQLKNYATTHKLLRQKTAEYADIRRKQVLIKTIRKIRTANSTLNKARTALYFRQRNLSHKSLIKWRKNAGELKLARQQKYLLHKTLRGWLRIRQAEKAKEDGKVRFYRTLLLKKHGLHLWKEAKNRMQLNGVADKFFLSQILQRWREYLYQKRIKVQTLMKQMQIYKNAMQVKRV